MALVVIPNTFVPNTTIVSAQVNADFSALAAYINNGSGSFATNGYAVVPGGLYVQWGKALLVKSDGSAATTVTLPVTFPNAVFSVTASISNAFQTTPRQLTVQTTAETTSSFQINVAGGNTGETVSVFYMAIGN